MSDESQVSTTPTQENADNSSFEAEVSKALDSLDAKNTEPSNDEPANEDGADTNNEDDVPENGKEEEPKKEEQEDNTDIQYPKKFTNEDGSLNTKNLLKSYAELEPLLNQRAAWEKERAELLEKAKIADEIQAQKEAEATAAGYASANDMANMQEVVYSVAQEYSKYAYQTDDPQHTFDLLNRYVANPTADLMEEIELEFSTQINKHVAIFADRKLTELQNKANEAQQNQVVNNVKANISATVEKHRELFDVEPFKELYIKALQTYGDKFTAADAEVLVEAVGKLKDYYYNMFKEESSKKIENDKETNSLAGINPKSGKSGMASNKNISEMSEDEFKNVVYGLI